MIDITKANDAGLMIHCAANLTQPVTTHGYYHCTLGHAHYVSWLGRVPQVSRTGYDWAFVGAVDKADEAAICAGHPSSMAYEHAYRDSIRASGYGHLLLPESPALVCDHCYTDQT